MKVPKIALWRRVKLPGDDRLHVVNHIDTTANTFRVRDNREPFSMDLYDPVPDWDNFLQAVEEWDYYYANSEGPRYEEGKEMKAALIEFFQRLPQGDQHRIQKIVDIVVSVK